MTDHLEPTQVTQIKILCKNLNDAVRDLMLALHEQPYFGECFEYQSDGGPLIKLQGPILWVDHFMLSLSSRPTTLRLIKAFFSNQELSLSREEICSAIYGDMDEKSPRFVIAKSTAMTKLLSRTRGMLEQALTRTEQQMQISWLVYNDKTQRYHLFKYFPINQLPA